MNKILFSLIMAVCLVGCKSEVDKVKIQGEIKGLENDTIYLCGSNERGNILDTIRVQKNKFVHITRIDTITAAFLFFGGQQYPLYLDKGNKIKIKGDIDGGGILEVKGNPLNEQLTSFNKTLSALEQPADSIIEEKAEEFIRLNQFSLVSVHLLDKYFVQKSQPDFAKIKSLIAIMDGELQDKPYVNRISKYIEQYEKADAGKNAPSFSIPDANGKKVNRYDFRNKYLLLTFWASWCDSCKTTNAELRELYKTYKKEENIAILGISLDADKAAWQQTIKSDSLEWQQLCDLSGWESSVISQYAILKIPFNILIGSDGRILAHGIEGEELKKKLEELIEKKEKEPQKGKRILR